MAHNKWCNAEPVIAHHQEPMKTLIKRTAVLLLLTTLVAIVSSGCNTARGFGKDVERAGEKIQDGTK